MTTKILSGTYANGYTLAAAYAGVSLTPTGMVITSPGYPAGTALTLPNGGSVVDRGVIAGGNGVAGQNASGSYVPIYPGAPPPYIWQVNSYASPGGAGGVGINAAKTTTITNLGTVTGGAGGYGGAGYSPSTTAPRYGLLAANGGDGAAAIVLQAGGVIVNEGRILGGAGGAGGGTNGSYGAGNGGSAGVGILSLATSRIKNLGLIVGGGSGFGGGAFLDDGDGANTPGAAGIALQAGGTVTNLGTIRGGTGFPIYGGYYSPGDGIDTTGGLVTNGDLTHGSATITGYVGVSMSGPGTIVNFATIAGVGITTMGGYYLGTAVRFGSTSGVLIAEGGSTFIGSVIGGGGTLQLRAGATGTIDGISGFGKVSFATGASWVFEGDNEIPTGLAVHPGGTITVDGTLATHGLIAADVTVAGELAVAGGNALSLIGGTLTNLAGGTLTGGTFMVGAGERLQLADNAPITTLGATIELLGAKATVESLDTLSGREVGLRSSLTAIGSAGVLEIAGGASFALFNSIANNGTIEALGGAVSLAGAVSGTGSVEIGGGGMATIAGAFTQNVSFAAGTGELKLGKSQGYTGTISGFSTTGVDSLDLADIGFTSGTMKASFSGTTAGGVLTVTDGTHTANIHLAGDYAASTWSLASDGHGGTTVVDPAATGAANAAPLASAIAGFAPVTAAPTHILTAHFSSPVHLLAAPRSAMAP